MNKLFILSVSMLLCSNLIAMAPDLTSEEQGVYDYLISQAKQGLEIVPLSYKTRENVSILEKQRNFLQQQLNSQLWKTGGQGRWAYLGEGVIAFSGTVLGFPIYVGASLLNYFKNIDILADIKTGALGLIIGSWVPYVASVSYNKIAEMHNNLISRFWKKQLDEIKLIYEIEKDFKNYIKRRTREKMRSGGV
jgi:hypothetical protein